MESYKFISAIKYGNTLPDFTQEQIKNEPMFFSSSVEYAYEKGGPITRAFLDAVEPEVLPNAVFDSRSHMLMPGFWPCIPGWHHDDVPRTDRHRLNGQPNYIDPEYKAEHVMALINGHIAPTEFAVSGFEIEYPFPGPGSGKNIYELWDEFTNNDIDYRILQKVAAPSNRLIYFDCDTLHQGTQAVASGWRWFGRLSWDTLRPITNEIRNQVQIYMEIPKKGW